jgi:catechol 2,3-dioxygenase
MAPPDAFEWPSGRPRITHMGINVIDIDAMVEFYTRVLGLSVSDFGFSERLQCKLAFLTSDPGSHHQVVMVATRSQDSESTVNQISFTVPALDDLRAANRRLTDEGIETNPINHGNAWSVYFPDPEGNLLEIYLDAPFYVPQPQGEPLDLALGDDEILARTEQHFSTVEGFTTRAAWIARRRREIDGDAGA